MVSNIADFDEKAITFDDVMKASINLLDKKGKAKAKELWDKIIEESAHGDDAAPTTEE